MELGDAELERRLDDVDEPGTIELASDTEDDRPSDITEDRESGTLEAALDGRTLETGSEAFSWYMLKSAGPPQY